MTRSRIAAGLLMYRVREGELEVLLAHPGGPFFRKKDNGAWTIPKGEVRPLGIVAVALSTADWKGVTARRSMGTLPGRPASRAIGMCLDMGR